MAKRQATPWDRISALGFMRDVVDEAGDKEPVGATLRLRRRPEVMTRHWFEMEWSGADGKRHSVQASSLRLLMERAAKIELGARAADEDEWGE